jgi:hypothetical protein
MAHVKGHYATNKTTGKKYWVKDHDDKRHSVLAVLHRMSSPKIHLEEEQVIDSNDINTIPLPRKADFERLLEMTHSVLKESLLDDDDKPLYRTWQKMASDMDVDDFGDWGSSYSEIYNKFHKITPRSEEIENEFSIGEVLKHYLSKYRNNELPDSSRSTTSSSPKLTVQDIPSNDEQTFWKPGNSPKLTKEQVAVLWQDANAVGRTKDVKSSREKARHILFLAYNTDKELYKKLPIDGATDKMLNREVRKWTGTTATALTIQNMLNRGVPEQFGWSGISNSTYINRLSVPPEDVEKFVKSVEIGDSKGRRNWFSDPMETTRRYLVDVLLSIDTRIDYKDLTVEVGSLNGVRGNSSSNKSSYHPMGLYNNEKKKITLDDQSEETLSHEIGHYLDYKFGEELNKYWSNLSDVTSGMINNAQISDDRKQWARDYIAFVDELHDSADISSEYMMERTEVVARFVAKFHGWTVKNAGVHYHDPYDGFRRDNFTDSQYRKFVSLLQQRAYLNAREGIPSQVVKKSLILKAVKHAPKGSSEVNPKTGKIIRGGEFAPMQTANTSINLPDAVFNDSNKRSYDKWVRPVMDKVARGEVVTTTEYKDAKHVVNGLISDLAYSPFQFYIARNPEGRSSWDHSAEYPEFMYAHNLASPNALKKIEKFKATKKAQWAQEWADHLLSLRPFCEAFTALKDKAVSPLEIKKQDKESKESTARQAIEKAPFSAEGLKKTETMLKKITESTKQEMIKWTASNLRSIVSKYESARKPGETLYALTYRLFPNHNERGNSAARAEYNQRLRPFVEDNGDVKKDIEDVILRSATKTVEETQQAFIGKVLSKVTPMVANKKLAKARVAAVEYRRGILEANIHFDFEDKSKFLLCNKIVFKTSQYGTPFYQYPSTFHDVVLSNGEKMAQPSEQRMNKEFLGLK